MKQYGRRELAMARAEVCVVTQPTVSVRIAAELLGIDERVMRRALRQREVPSFRIGSKTLIPTGPLRRMLGIERSAEWWCDEVMAMVRGTLDVHLRSTMSFIRKYEELQRQGAERLHLYEQLRDKQAVEQEVSEAAAAESRREYKRLQGNYERLIADLRTLQDNYERLSAERQARTSDDQCAVCACLGASPER